MTPHSALERLIQTMATLRSEDGCEWDRQQTHQSLLPFLIEEAHELVDAVETGTDEDIKEELGDVLYQVLFHADIAASKPDGFTIDDVAEAVDTKMRRRHPHVFEGVSVDGVEDIKANWQQIKAQEKANRESALDGVPRSLEGVARWSALLTRAEREGFNLPEPPGSEPDTTEGWGHWLLDVLAAAKSRGIDVEAAMRQALRERETQWRAEEAGSSVPE